MAQKTVVIDDIDETEGASRVEFSLNGEDYEIDLNEANQAKLRKALEKYIQFGRKVPRARRNIKAPQRTHTTVGTATSPADLDAIRQWGRANGFQVSDRGRIKQEVQDAFNAAHAPGASNTKFSHADA